MKILLPLFLLIGLSLQAVSQESILTNDSIVEMAKAGIPASVIITKIKTSPVKFDTNTPALKALTDAKVAEDVISAMIERSAADKPAERVPAKTEVEVTKEPVPRPASPPFTPYSQLEKQYQKERIKSPARIEIAAPADKVSALLIRAFQSWEYQIESESARTLMLSKPVKGFGNQLLVGMAMGGNNMRYKVQISVAEYQGISSIIVSAWVTSDNAFGKTNQENLDKNKKWRAPLDDLLLAVKQSAEALLP